MFPRDDNVRNKNDADGDCSLANILFASFLGPVAFKYSLSIKLTQAIESKRKQKHAQRTNRCVRPPKECPLNDIHGSYRVCFLLGT